MTYRTNRELNRYRCESGSSESSQPKRVRARKYAPMTAERYDELQRRKEEIERRVEEFRTQGEDQQ